MLVKKDVEINGNTYRIECLTGNETRKHLHLVTESGIVPILAAWRAMTSADPQAVGMLQQGFRALGNYEAISDAVEARIEVRPKGAAIFVPVASIADLHFARKGLERLTLCLHAIEWSFADFLDEVRPYTAVALAHLTEWVQSSRKPQESTGGSGESSAPNTSEVSPP